MKVKTFFSPMVGVVSGAFDEEISKWLSTPGLNIEYKFGLSCSGPGVIVMFLYWMVD